jgi:hypothetical protein
MPLCPRCLNQELSSIPSYNPLSKRNNEPICQPCSQEEAMVDLHRIRISNTVKDREDRMAARPKVKADPSRPTKKAAKANKKNRNAETPAEAMKRRRKKDAPKQKPEAEASE